MSDRPIIYMDACCFIDAVKFAVGNLPTHRNDDAWHVKTLLEASHAREVEVITSMLSIAECVAVEHGQEAVPLDVQDHFRRLLTSGQYVTLAPQTPKTGKTVQDLRWVHGLVLRGADSLHLATAMERGALEFISSDEKLTKPKMIDAAQKLTGSGIRLIRASNTVHIPDHRLQGEMLGG